ncbi:MAG: adenylate cyclase [Alsobacter sp.]
MFVERDKPRSDVAVVADYCPDEVRHQVERICAAPDFANSERLKNFLRFIVEEKLAGRGDRLKAYAIALAVFSREPTFDPQADPIVRIEAGRLRRALEHYYLTDGRDDPVLIDVPKGSYAPHVTVRWQPEAAPIQAPRNDEPDNVQQVAVTHAEARRWRPAFVLGAAAALLLAVIGLGTAWMALREASKEPVLLVLPFATSGDNPIGSLVSVGLTGALIDTLAGGSNLRVMGRETTRWAQSDMSLPAMRQSYGLTHVLEGEVLTEGDKVTISTRLVEARSGAILWVRRYQRGRATPLSDIQADIGARILATLDPTGVARQLAAAGASDAAWDSYACKLRFYQYRTDLTPENHAAVRQCLEDTVRRFPTDGSAWAMLSLILVDELRGAAASDGGDRQAVLSSARTAAERAVALAPRDARSLEALALSLYFARKPVEGRAAAEQAMALAPHDPELLGELGPRIAQAGDWKTGRDLLVEAIELNPANAGYYSGHLAFIAFMQGDIGAASGYIARTNLAQFPTRFLIEALVATELGEAERAAQARQRFLQRAPGFIARLDEEMAQRNMTPEDADRLRRAVVKAGFARP